MAEQGPVARGEAVRHHPVVAIGVGLPQGRLVSSRGECRSESLQGLSRATVLHADHSDAPISGERAPLDPGRIRPTLRLRSSLLEYSRPSSRAFEDLTTTDSLILLGRAP